MHGVPAVGVHVDQQLVAGDAGVVDDDVDARRAARAGARSAAAAASAAVMSSCSAVPPISLATSASASPAAGMSTATTCAPSRASTSAIAAPMPRAAPVTTATLPASGWSASVGRSGTSAGRQRDRLAVDVGRAAGQEEPHRATRSEPSAPSGTRAGWPSTRRAAPCRWSGPGRPAPAGRRPAPGTSASAGGSAEDEHPPGGAQPLERRGEEVVRARPGRPGPASPVRVEDHARPSFSPSVAPSAATGDCTSRRRPEQRGDGVAQPALARRADDRRAGQQRLRPARSGAARPAGAGRAAW